MSKYHKSIRYILRILSLAVSIALVILLVWYAKSIWPMYEWALTENKDIGVSLLVVINECMDLFILAVIIWAAIMVPVKAFYYTRQVTNV